MYEGWDVTLFPSLHSNLTQLTKIPTQTEAKTFYPQVKHQLINQPTDLRVKKCLNGPVRNQCSMSWSCCWNHCWVDPPTRPLHGLPEGSEGLKPEDGHLIHQLRESLTSMTIWQDLLPNPSNKPLYLILLLLNKSIPRQKFRSQPWNTMDAKDSVVGKLFKLLV